MIPIKTIRATIRDFLDMADGFGKDIEMIQKAVNHITGESMDLQTIRTHLEWNIEAAYVRSEKDEEAETVLYYITPSGTARVKRDQS